MRAIEIEEFGGPEVLQLVEVEEPAAGPGQVLIDVRRAGVNYADTHHADDTYVTPSRLPLIPGTEVAGTTPDGRRVVALVTGGYAERVAADEVLTFDVPDEVDDGHALALVLQGLTAWHLLRTTAQMRKGETVVVHAAAGGVGSLAVQLARLFGAGRVIGSASSQDKRQLAARLGADAVIDSRAADLRSAIVEANDRRPVDVVLDMLGGAGTDASLRALAPFGRLAFYGMASRQPPSDISPGALLRKSRGVLGFWLAHCMQQPAQHLAPQMAELLDLVRRGELVPVVGETYPLAQAADAHRALRARQTSGKLLLDVTA